MEDEGKIRNVAIPERIVERAPCKRCGRELRFCTGDYGQSLQRCGCFGGCPHPIVVDTTAPKPPMTAEERYERKRIALERSPREPGRPGRPRKPITS